MQIDVANMIAAIAAVSALALSIYTHRRQSAAERTAYMTLTLTLDRIADTHLIARTCLENRSPTVKHLDVVRLLVCPQSEAPETACQTLMDGPGRLHRVVHRAFIR
ncbi:hypothetical protein [Mycobacterium sp. IS-1742]|uniref:hypothetical protein n=1 Tax=Mycobacterium sp. IS-1742 TaxID=1772285 RepID=UPI000A94CDF8|nr:hypothetical protein [Mycobacterium sp. IS-1742]